MILLLAVAVATVATASGLVATLAVRMRLRSLASSAAAATTAQAAADPLESFGCHLGDVILRSVGGEAWLRGGVVLSEDRPVAALLIAPDKGGDTAVYVRPSPSKEVWWLSRVALDGAAAGEPPFAIEHAGRFERTRRLPLRAEAIGQGGPALSGTVIIAEYTGLGDARLVVIASGTSSFVFAGVTLAEGMFEIIPSGARTLEDSDR